MERLSTERGYPAFIRSDNGPEFIAAALVEWAEHHGVILDMYLFRSLSEVRTLTEDWRTEYNEERPHSSLGNMPPVIYARQNWMEILTGGGTKIGGTTYTLGKSQYLLRLSARYPQGHLHHECH